MLAVAKSTDAEPVLLEVEDEGLLLSVLILSLVTASRMWLTQAQREAVAFFRFSIAPAAS